LGEEREGREEGRKEGRQGKIMKKNIREH